MNPFVWLTIWVAGCLFSLMLHEIAHILTALKLGWAYHGMTIKWYVAGVGVKLEPAKEEGSGKQLAAIALAGPTGSAIAATIFLGLDQIHKNPIFSSLFFISIVVAVINLFPTPVTDGGHILTGLFGWQIKWRYSIVLWIIADVFVIMIMFL